MSDAWSPKSSLQHASGRDMDWASSDEKGRSNKAWNLEHAHEAQLQSFTVKSSCRHVAQSEMSRRIKKSRYACNRVALGATCPRLKRVQSWAIHSASAESNLLSWWFHGSLEQISPGLVAGNFACTSLVMTAASSARTCRLKVHQTMHNSQVR